MEIPLGFDRPGNLRKGRWVHRESYRPEAGIIAAKGGEGVLGPETE